MLVVVVVAAFVVVLLLHVVHLACKARRLLFTPVGVTVALRIGP